MRASTLLFAIAAFAVGAAQAQEGPWEQARAQTEAALNRTAESAPLCFPPHEGEAEAHVFYAYHGDELVDPALSAKAPRFKDVHVGPTEKPVYLVLSAYDPILWRVRSEPGARIAAVHLRGYYDQAVVGLPPGTPVGRSFFRLRTDGEFARCALAGDTATEATNGAPKIDERALRAEVSALRLEARRIGAALDQTKHRRDALTSILDELGTATETAPAIDVIARMASEAETRLADLRDQRASIEAEGERLRALFAQLARADAPPIRGPYSFDNPSQFDLLRNRLEDVEIVNFQRARDFRDVPLEASSAAAQAFRERRDRGRAMLEALVEPTLPMVPPDARRLAPPERLVGRDGLNFLVERGYLGRGGPAARYYCAKTIAQRLALGLPTNGVCRDNPTGGYVILGPIVFPTGLCGGNSVTFYQPSQAPEPEGSSCHSSVIRLADEPCIGDSGSCRFRQLRRRR